MFKRTVSGIMLTLFLLISTLTLAINIQSVETEATTMTDFDDYLTQSSVDWWPMFRHDPRRTGYTTSKGPDTNNTIWTYTTGAVGFSSPAVADGKVYVGSGYLDYKIYCLDASTGAYIWNYSIGDYVTPPAVANGRVYVGSGDHKVYCLNATSGAYIWNYTTGNYVWSSPAVVDGKVYVASVDHWLYCLNASTGAYIWGSKMAESSASSPAVAEGRVYVGSGQWGDDNKVYCLNATSGAHIWNYTTGNWVMSSPAVANGKLYIGSSDDNVYCLNATTGVQIWNYTTGGGVWSSPAVADGKVYVGSTNLYCLDASSGACIWSYATGDWFNSSPAVADGKVYVGSRGVYAFGPYDVTIKAHCDTEGVDVSVEIVMDGSPTGYTTPHTFTELGEPHSFTVPNADPNKHEFKEWNTGETSTTITVSTAGTYTAYYGIKRDVAVTEAISFKTVCGQTYQPINVAFQNYSVNINATIENQGDMEETFNVSAKYDSNVIDTITIENLPPSESVNVTFTWDTHGVAKGNYTISVEADLVPGENEENMYDNTCPGGWVMVTWLGDVTDEDHLTPPGGVPDGLVDENDLWYFCQAFIDYYKIHVKDRNCDFDDNCKIDEDDLWTMAEAFIDYWKQH